jgi:hypothetical protein
MPWFTLRGEGTDRTYFMTRYQDTHFHTPFAAQGGLLAAGANAGRNLESAFARGDMR